jgi:hypothetical protein
VTRFLSFLGHLVFPGAYGRRARGHTQWQEGTWEEEEEGIDAQGVARWEEEREEGEQERSRMRALRGGCDLLARGMRLSHR